MYLSEKFIDMGLEEGQEWPSPFHREVAVICLIQNPRVFTREKLARNVQVINSIDRGALGGIDVGGLIEKGCDFI